MLQNHYKLVRLFGNMALFSGILAKTSFVQENPMLYQHLESTLIAYSLV